MLIFLAIGSSLRIIKVFIYEPLCDQFIKAWNQTNIDDLLHKETYKVEQENEK